ncbi:hypothetical protein BDZ90DRAFT_257035 [Jaminaea rosea]|uniref:Uncharacterized protein n=1 Tax=Jaminaea rosea TaxID=1569628 RepID=A0A316V039_9BASI|nr:hypothetical protein BDZ90DRAFT_257035 [Jaminaea rosea]PWN29921.1 hypothetical protein BDZ90DRAFT_257035 [Jaminaea rosea]
MLFNKLATLAAVTGLALLTPTHGAADDKAVMQSVEARANVRLATCWYTLNCGGLGQAVNGPTLSTTNIQGNTCSSIKAAAGSKINKACVGFGCSGKCVDLSATACSPVPNNGSSFHSVCV